MTVFICLRISDISLYSFTQSSSPGQALGDIYPGLPHPGRARDSPGGEPVLGHTGQSHTWHWGCPLPAQGFSPAGAPTSSPPVPDLPRSSPSSTTVSSSGSEKLLKAHPPTFLPWERGSKYLEGFSRAGTSGQLRVNQQPVQTPYMLEKQEPEREEFQPWKAGRIHPGGMVSWAMRKVEEDLEREGREWEMWSPKDLILKKKIKPGRVWLQTR